MSIAAIQNLVTRQALDDEVLSHFINTKDGSVTLRFECEYWDYKRELFELDKTASVAELAADVLAFHNTRGGYIISGITNDYVVLGVHEDEALKIDSNILNSKLRRYIGQSFFCRYAPITLSAGGTRKTLGVVFIPPRKGIAIAAASDSSLFKEGTLLLRANDSRKRAETDSEFLFLFSPLEPEVIVGSHQLRTYSPKPGTRLFHGDYTRFIGENTREPLIAKAIDELVYGKWDVVLFRGVGGVGKTAAAIEVTRRLATDPDYAGHFGGVISLSAKDEELTPYDRRAIEPEVASYDQFLRQILLSAEWEGDIPKDTSSKERIVKDVIRQQKILLFIDNYETIEVRESRISGFLADLPAGSKTFITSRHQPTWLPALPIVVNPLDNKEAELLAVTEATAQRVSASITERYLEQIVEVSGRVPLAIKWIISCSKNAEHLNQLIEDHRRGKPALANLCEFCFTFEYNLLSPTAKTALALFPLFKRAPSVRELAIAADVEDEVMRLALNELIDFSLVITEHSQRRDDVVYRILQLTASFAAAKLTTLGDLDKQARRRLRVHFGPSMQVLLDAAKEMVERGATGAARSYIDDEILERDPTNALAHFLRGRAFEQELQYTAAIHDYERAIAHCGGDGALRADSALRIVSLVRSGSRPREDMIPLLERTYGTSGDTRLALELAKTFEMLGRAEDAKEYYSKVYENYSPARLDTWEEAVTFICQELRNGKGDEEALEWLKEAQRICPGSKAVSRFEQKLKEDLGLVKYKRTGPLDAPRPLDPPLRSPQ